LLADDPGATTVAGDIRSPDDVLAAAAGTGLLDLSRPIAVLMIAVLHFVTDDADPVGMIGTYARAAAPGSLVAVSHGRSGVPGTAELARVYDQPGSPSSMRLRSQAEVGALLAPLAPVAPGVVLLPLWRPELTDDPGEPDDDHPVVVGVGRRE
jgi:hypothetical protein